MKVTLSNLTDTYLQEFELIKKVDNDFLVEELQTNLLYKNRADFDVLLNGCVVGEDKEEGTLTGECGFDEWEKNVHIKHNEGKFSIRECSFEKPLHITNVLDCVINNTINIYEYTPSVTQTIQGTLERTTEFLTGNALYNFRETITLEQIFAVLGGVPDKSADGYFPEYIFIRAYPLIYNIFDEDLGEYIDTYNGHELTMEVIYIRIKSATQYNYLWRPIPSTTDYFFSGVPQLVVGNAKRYVQTFYEGEQSFDYFEVLESETGKLNRYSDVDISNTYHINEIIEDIFTCTGLMVVSDFLGINPDGTAPINRAYTFAELYCKEIKICQSYDIIRESALMDSFSVSGDIKVKDFLNNILKMFNLVIVPGELEVRIEHKSYYLSKGSDLVTQEIEYELGEFDINKEQIDAEEFSYGQPTPTENFYLTRIEYDRVGLYNEENVKQIKIEKILTDVFGTINDENFEENEYKTLFYLLSTQDNEIIGLNTQFSMFEIVTNLHDINRPSKRGMINGSQTVFDTYSIGLESQIKIVGSMKVFNKLAPFYTLKIKEGTFMIKEMSLNDKDEITFTVVK